MELKGSKTEQNLRTALAGESIARNKYTYFGDHARKEGSLEIAEMYERLARNESTHARLWYTALNGEIPNDLMNLRNSAAGEFDEWSGMYPSFAKTAREEGFEELAIMFEHVANIEKDHERQFMEAIIALSKKIRSDAEKAPESVDQAEEQLAETLEVKAEEELEELEEAVPAAKAPRAQVETVQEKVRYRCAFCGSVYDERYDVCPLCQAIGAWETILEKV